MKRSAVVHCGVYPRWNPTAAGLPFNGGKQMTLAIENALDLENPQPGIYPGVPFADYQNIHAMNCSTLAWIKGSPAHMKEALDGNLEREDTAALGFGRALHVRILEPDSYTHRVKVKGPCAQLLKSGDRKNQPCGKSACGCVDGNWLCGTHGGNSETLDPNFEYLTVDEAARVEKAAAALRDRKLDTLRRARGMFEVVMIAEVCGVLCKVRLDKYIEKPCAIVDVKKVAGPKSPGTVIDAEGFESRIAKYGYGMIAALYCDVVEKLTGKMPRWYWLSVEDNVPFTPAVYRASDTCLAAGRNEYRALLHKYKNCINTGIWPGPADEPMELDGPKWWLAQNTGSN